jgi:hypothetical protein
MGQLPNLRLPRSWLCIKELPFLAIWHVALAENQRWQKLLPLRSCQVEVELGNSGKYRSAIIISSSFVKQGRISEQWECKNQFTDDFLDHNGPVWARKSSTTLVRLAISSSLVSGGSAFAAIGNRQIRKAKILLTLHCLNKLFQDQYHHGLHQIHLPAT